jgi:hypothetical protein
MKRTHAARRAMLAGVLAAAAVTAAPAGASAVMHSRSHISRGDSGLAGCTELARVQLVPAASYPRLRALFAHSRWPGLRIAGTAYAELATALLRVPHAYGGETVWFYERLSSACKEHGRPLHGNA